MTAATHPLFGAVLNAAGFKRLSGVLHLVVGLPDGTPGTIVAAATNVFGNASVTADDATLLDVEGVRRLRALTEALSRQRRSGRRRK